MFKCPIWKLFFNINFLFFNFFILNIIIRYKFIDIKILKIFGIRNQFRFFLLFIYLSIFFSTYQFYWVYFSIFNCYVIYKFTDPQLRISEIRISEFCYLFCILKSRKTRNSVAPEFGFRKKQGMYQKLSLLHLMALLYCLNLLYFYYFLPQLTRFLYCNCVYQIAIILLTV